jgi:hypothetical protein
MTKPLVLTREEVEKLINGLNMVEGCIKSDQPIFAGIHVNCLIELLTSPRTEALGLSKEEWIYASSSLGGSMIASDACRQIASSLSDKGEA